MTIEITNESAHEVDLIRVQNLAEHVREALRLHPLVDVGIIFVDEDPMTELHVRWMDEPGPTDVLSFPMDELRPGSAELPSPEGVLGDVVICPQVAARQAEGRTVHLTDVHRLVAPLLGAMGLPAQARISLRRD